MYTPLRTCRIESRDNKLIIYFVCDIGKVNNRLKNGIVCMENVPETKSIT